MYMYGRVRVFKILGMPGLALKHPYFYRCAINPLTNFYYQNLKKCYLFVLYNGKTTFETRADGARADGHG